MLTLIVRQLSDGRVQYRRNFNEKHITLGRGNDCDLVLKDPQRRISKCHCELLRTNHSKETLWVVKDVSKNGTRLNHEPLITGKEEIFFSGDTIQIADYEITLSDASSHGSQAIFSEIIPDEGTEAFLSSDFTLSGDHTTPLIGLEKETHKSPIPLGSMATQHSTSFGLDSPFLPPKASHNEVENHSHSTIGDDFLDSLLDNLDHEPAGPPVENITPSATPPASFPIETTAHPLPHTSSTHHGLQTFLRGASLSTEGALHLSAEEAEETLEKMGRTFRSMIKGLRQVIIARSEVKSEFRIERTVIHPFGNNPLKFAVNDVDALWALIGIGRKTDVPPEDTISEVFQDIQQHELALKNAILPALEAFLQAYSIEAVSKSFGVDNPQDLSWWKGSAAWREAVLLHKAGKTTLKEGSNGLFGRAFAKAYESFIHEIKNNDIYSTLMSEQSDLLPQTTLRKTK